MAERQGVGPEIEGAVTTRCACGGRLGYEVVHRYPFTDDSGRAVEIHNVPAAVCERCGDAILDPAVVAEIGNRLTRHYFIPRHLNLAAD